MDTSDQDDQLVARIGRLVDESGVVRGLSALYMTDHEASATPRSFLDRITGQVEDLVGDVVDPVHDLLRKAMMYLKKLLVATPVVEGNFMPSRVQPRLVSFSRQGMGRPQPNSEFMLQLLDYSCDLFLPRRFWKQRRRQSRQRFNKFPDLLTRLDLA